MTVSVTQKNLIVLGLDFNIENVLNGFVNFKTANDLVAHLFGEKAYFEQVHNKANNKWEYCLFVGNKNIFNTFKTAPRKALEALNSDLPAIKEYINGM